MKGSGRPKQQRKSLPESSPLRRLVGSFMQAAWGAMTAGRGHGYRKGSQRRDAEDVRRGDRRADKIAYAEMGISQDMRRYQKRYS